MNFASINDGIFGETSAKENTGIKELFIKIAKKLYLKQIKVRKFFLRICRPILIVIDKTLYQIFFQKI